MPPYVGFYRDPRHVPGGGYLGIRYDPINGHRAARLPDHRGFGALLGVIAEADESIRFTLPDGVSQQRLHDRSQLLAQLDRLRSRRRAAGSAV